MQEKVILFETAKLAKEKGFEDKVNIIHGKSYYNHLGVLNGDVTDCIKDFVKHKQEGTPLDDSLKQISAPTQSLLQKWLREVHSIDCHAMPVRFTGDDEVGYYTYAVKSIQPVGRQIYKFNTWEDALEIGLQEALKLI